ncbi:MAG TPA: hypothetical protein VM597_22650 [Gemmataceae bacterium]|nr:hypothetical protein [Gemmataceae bacterium]
MARVRLSSYECSRNLLPDVCMFGGEPASERKPKSFSWHPGWVWVLVLLSPLIAFIVAIILTKRMAVRVPVCAEHAGYWFRRNLILVGSFALVSALGVAGVAYVSNQPPGPKDDLAGWVCGGGVVLFFAWLIAAMVYSARGVRPDEITDRNIRLTGVHEGFIDALEEDRASDLDYRERDRYDDERDDYDDERGGAPRRGRSYDDTDYRPRRRRRDPDAPDDRPRGRGRDDDRRGYDDDRDDRPRRRRDEYDD